MWATTIAAKRESKESEGRFKAPDAANNRKRNGYGHPAVRVDNDEHDHHRDDATSPACASPHR